MGLHETKNALSHVPGIDSLTMQYGAAGTQIFIMGDVKVELPADATNSDIAAALLANPFLSPTPGIPMTITGFQPGAIKAAIDAAKQKSQSQLADAMAKLSAAQEKAASVPAAIAQVAASMEKEADDALQELATFTNGGPA